MADSGHIIRLFVSSTFSDFAVERDILQRVVFPQLRQLCATQGYRFQPIDLRWGVSEEAGNEKRTLTICFEEIRRCQVLSPELNFLVLLGDRYGSCFLPASIPSAQVGKLLPYLSTKDQDLFGDAYHEDVNALPAEYVLLPVTQGGRDEERLRAALGRAARAAGLSDGEALLFEASATHLEILRGLLAPDTEPQAVLYAVRSFSKKPNGQVSAVYVEQDPHRRTSLKHLKRSVELRLVGQPLHYTVPWNKAGPVIDREEMARQLLALLEPQVRAVIARRQEAAKGRDVVSVANRRFAAERATLIEGRDDELTQVATYLDGSTPLPLVVTGAPGAGKSSLLARAVTDAARTHPEAEIVARYIGVTPGTSGLTDLLGGLRREIAERYGKPAPAPIADLAQLVAAVFQELETLEVPAERPLFLLLDALDQLSTHPARVDWLPRRLAPHVRLVASVLHHREEEVNLRAWLPEAQVLTLGPLTPEQGATVLHHWLAEEGRTLQPTQERSVLASFAPEGNPLYLRLASERARTWRSFDAVEVMPTTIPGLLDQFFARLEQPAWYGREMVAHALGDLGAARNGMAEDELLDVLVGDDAVRASVHALSPGAPPIDPALPLPVVLWARPYADLERYLTQREADGTQLVTFYHWQVREEVERRYLQGEDGIARHRELARYFERQPLLVGPQPSLRKLAEQPFQEAAGDLATEFTHTLTDIAFLEQKIAHQGTAGALEDLALRPEDWMLEQVAAAIRAGTHVLDRAPEQLESQLRGRMPMAMVAQLHSVPERPSLRLDSPTLSPGGGSLVRVFTGHTDAVYGCAFSPDGRLVLSASHDHTLRLWEVATGRIVRVLTGHTDAVNGCAFSPDGRFVLSSSYDHTLRLWEVATGGTIHMLVWHSDAVAGCAFSPDGRMAVSASWDGTLGLWDLASGDATKALGHGRSAENGCAFSPDGRFVLCASRDLWLWNVADREGGRKLAGHADEVDDCAFSPNGRLALSASHDGTLRIWDLRSGKTVHVLVGHTGVVHGCAFSPDGSLVLSASWDGTLRLWDAVSGQVIQTLAEHTGAVEDCAFSPDGRLVLSASSDRTLRLWDVASGRTIHRLRHPNAIYDCAFSPDGLLALSASAPRDRLLTDPDAFSRPHDTLLLWNVISGEPVRALDGHTTVVTCCAFSPDGHLALSGSWDKTLRLWDLESGQPIHVFEGHTAWVTRCAFSPDGRLVLSASSDHTLRLWEVATGQTVHVLEGHTWEACRCAFSPDGRLVLSASSDGTLRIWDVESGQAVRVLTGHVVLAFSPDRRQVLSVSSEKTLQLWNLESDQAVRPLGHVERIDSCVFSPDGRLVLGASHDHTLRLWDVKSGDEITRWFADRELWCCAFSPDGAHVMAGDQGGNLHFLTAVGLPSKLAFGWSANPVGGALAEPSSPESTRRGREQESGNRPWWRLWERG